MSIHRYSDELSTVSCLQAQPIYGHSATGSSLVPMSLWYFGPDNRRQSAKKHCLGTLAQSGLAEIYIGSRLNYRGAIEFSVVKNLACVLMAPSGPRGYSTMSAMSRCHALVFLKIILCASAQQLILRIDDSNVYTPTNMNGIQYLPDWSHYLGSDANGRFNNTLSVTTTADAAVVCFFKGSSITYYSDRASSEASVMISLDGQSPQRISVGGEWALQDWLWSSTQLDGGDHQLIISRIDSTSEYSLSLDFFDVTYLDTAKPSTLGPGATNAFSEYIIDDGHELIHYEGNWIAMNPNPQQSFFYSGLQHTTTTPGSSLTFIFDGSEIYYFSDKRVENGWALISIDGGAGELVSTFLEPWDDRWFSQALCWSKTGLGDGPHTINITHSDEPGKYVSLDFFKYASHTGKKRVIPRTAIIAGSVGGGVLIVISAIVLYLIHRRLSSTPEVLQTELGDLKEETGTPRAAELQARPLSYTSKPRTPDNQTTVNARPESELKEKWANGLYTGLPEPQTV
ncbi:unnamed protein product [Rhizoctonia solani]|uniref:Uncharacterized protein n=1 Tax=Rhizoctonia solani TaxID=456999 RepID=A0A8H3BBB4_9AGAM|nr:unnamed protein product [Rhizoctonia solani]